MGTGISANGASTVNESSSTSLEGPRPVQRALTPYQTLLRSLSDRLVEAQRPIRILDAIKWDPSIEEAFFASGARELPLVTRDFYAHRALPFDADQKQAEFRTLERDIRRRLGEYNPAGQIMTRMCEEYRQVVDLLMLRGTPSFSILSERLYGSSTDSFHAGDPTLADLGQVLGGILDNLSQEAVFCQDEPRLDARQTVEILASRLSAYFKDEGAVRVQISDDLVADAAAGCDYIKIREDARFSPREVRLLEVHEGWVHLGTTLNGAGSTDLHLPQQGAALHDHDAGGPGRPDRDFCLCFSSRARPKIEQPHRRRRPGRSGSEFPRRLPLLPATGPRTTR